MFKLQDPKDLITRLYILEYMRDITAEVIYLKSNEHQKRNFFYKFENENNNTSIDFNWEYTIFKATMVELEFLMKNVMKEVDTVEEQRQKELNNMREKLLEEEVSKPIDINIMSLAQTEINRNKNAIWTQPK